MRVGDRHKEQMKRDYRIEDWHDLDFRFARFAIRELRRFRATTNSHPGDMTWDEWKSNLEEMIAGFQFTLDDRECKVPMQPLETYMEAYNKAKERRHLFAEHFGSLWI